jgi:hypothetical protein
MTPLEFIVMVAGFTVQVAGLVYLARILHAMRHSFTPGEAAIFKEMRRLLEDGA